MPGIKQQQVVFEPFVAFGGQVNFFKVDFAAFFKLDEIEAAAGAGILILFTDRLVLKVDFNMASLLGDFFLGHVGFVVGVAQVNEPGGKG